MSVTIWHNPRCSKSRAALALLEDRDAAPEIRRYLEDPPSEDEIRDALKALGIGPLDLVRRGEKLYRELGLSAETDDDTLIAAMAANPILIERPVVFIGEKAALGRPPEAVLDLL